MSNLPEISRKNLIILLKFVSAGVLIDTLGVGMVTPLLPSFSDRFNLSQSSLSLFLTMRGFTSIAVSLPIGIVVPWIGYRNVAIYALWGTVFSSLFLSFPLDWYFLPIALLLQGACSELVWANGLSLAAEIYGRKGSTIAPEIPNNSSTGNLLDASSTEGNTEGNTEGLPILAPLNNEEETGIVGAVGALLGMAALGYLIGPFFGAVLYEYAATWVPYFILMVVTLFAILGIVLWTEQQESLLKNTTGEVDTLEAPLTNESLPATRPAASQETLLATFSRVSKNPKIIILLLTVVVTSISIGAQDVLLPFHVMRDCGMQTSTVGLIFATVAISYGLTSTLAESYASFFAPSYSLVVGLIGQAVFSPLFFLPKVSCSVLFQMGLGTLFGASYAFNATPIFPLIVEELDRVGISTYSVAIAFYNFSYNFGNSLGPMVAAAFLQLMSSFQLLMVVSTLLVAIVPFVCWAMRT